MSDLIGLLIVIPFFLMNGFALGGAIFLKNIFLRIVLGVYSFLYLAQLVKEFRYSYNGFQDLFGLLLAITMYGFGIWLARRYARTENGQPQEKEESKVLSKKNPNSAYNNIQVPSQRDPNSAYSNIKVEWSEEDDRQIKREFDQDEGIKLDVSILGILFAVFVSFTSVLIIQNPQYILVFTYVVFPTVFAIGMILLAGVFVMTVLQKGNSQRRTREINWYKTLVLMFLIIAIPVAWAKMSENDRNRSNDSRIHQKLEESYKALGYSGQIKGVKTHITYGGSIYNVAEYSYVENVNGTEVVFQLAARFDDSGKLSLHGPAEASLHQNNTEIQLDHPIKNKAMFEQPQAKTYFSIVFEDVKRQTLSDKLTLHSVSARVSRNEEGQKIILSKFEENKKLGKPLNGYYDIDIKDLANKHYVEFYVNYNLNEPFNTPSRPYFDKILNYVKTKDFSRYWDGIYHFNFDYKYNGGHSSSITDDVIVTIKDGQAIRFTSYDGKSLEIDKEFR